MATQMVFQPFSIHQQLLLAESLLHYMLHQAREIIEGKHSF